MLQTIVDWCIRRAANRWPSELRDDQTQEWLAELHSMRGEESGWTQLRFAWSLAWAPPVEDANGVIRGWREALPRMGQGLQPLLALAGAGAATYLISSPVQALTMFSVRVPYVVLGWLLALGSNIWLGRTMGRSLPITWAHRRSVGSAGSLLTGSVAIAIGMAFFVVLPGLLSADYRPYLLAAMIFSFGPLALVGWAVVRLVHSGRRIAAWVAGVVGVAVVIDLAGMIAAASLAQSHELFSRRAFLWAPLSLVPGQGEFNDTATDDSQLVYLARGVVIPLLLIAILLLAYGLRASRLPTRVQSAAPQPDVGVQPELEPWQGVRQRFGFGLAVVALAIWAYLVSELAGAYPPGLNRTQEPMHLWAQEMRLSAIALAVLGVILMLAGRTAVVLPALGSFLAMGVIDMALDRFNVVGMKSAGIVFAAGMLILYGAWHLGHLLRSSTPGAMSERRVLAGAAALTMFCMPVAALSFPSDAERYAEASNYLLDSEIVLFHRLWICNMLLMAAMTAAALLTALCARSGPVRWSRAIWPVLLISAVVPAATLVNVEFYAVWPKKLLVDVLAMPLVVVVLAVIVWQRPTMTVAYALKWALAVVGGLIAALPVFVPQYYCAALFGIMFHRLSGASGDGHPFPMFGSFWFGSVLVGLGVAGFVISRITPPLDPLVTSPDRPMIQPGLQVSRVGE